VRGRARRLARRLPPGAKQALRRLGVAGKRPRWGNLRRLRPFSERYGFDRGTPVDRYYIEGFLERHADDVRGSVLEMDNPEYTQRFGGKAVTVSEILDIDAENARATIVADLSEPGSLPAARFDCFVLTQTLQYVSGVEEALANAWQSLAPGGVLLLSVPSLSRMDAEVPEQDLGRFTVSGVRAALGRACPGGHFEVVGCGNLVAAVASLQGLAAEELRDSELDVVDAAFPVVVCARAEKPAL
jgi:SAM-dependent methyltransferase